MVTHMVTKLVVLKYTIKGSITVIGPGIAPFIHMIQGNVDCHAMKISKSEMLHAMYLLQVLMDNIHSLWGGRYFMDC